MKITIESTNQITEINGPYCRVWKGVTDSGTKCFVFIPLIAVHNSENQEEFARELQEKLPPGSVISLRQVL